MIYKIVKLFDKRKIAILSNIIFSIFLKKSHMLNDRTNTILFSYNKY
jgi:hypothetical protein